MENSENLSEQILKNKEKELRNAAANGNATQVRELLKIKGIKIDSTSTNDNTSLMWAIEKAKAKKNKKGYFSTIAILLANGAKINAKDKQAINEIFPNTEATLHNIIEIEQRHPGYLKFFYNLVNIAYVQNLEAEIIAHFAHVILSATLLYIFKSIEMQPRTIKNNIVNILDIACGECHALIPLLFFYKDYQINYVAVDNDEEAIEHNQNFFENIKNTKFITGNAADPKNLVKLGLAPGSFDLVLFRNPNFSYAYQVFADMALKTLPVFLKPGGNLYMSFYENDSRIFQKKIYQKEKFNIQDSCQLDNPPQIILKQGPMKPDQYTLWGELTNQFIEETNQDRLLLEKEFTENLLTEQQTVTKVVSP